MIVKFKYYFSRLLVLIVALHILNVSIDIDYMTAGGSVVNMEEFDDVDSFVELIAENISHDPKLIKETHNDAHSPIEIRSIKLSNVVLYAGSKEKPDLAPASISAIIAKPRLTNTSFQFEDYSSPAFDPPDPLVC